MKLGNFVGQGFLPFDKKEISDIKKQLSSVVYNALGKDYFKKPVVKYNEDHTVISLTVSFPFKKNFNGRNQYKSVIKDASEIIFVVTKSKKGYLEIKDKDFPYDISKYRKDYDNCPEFSYGCNMIMLGRERPYRCKMWRSIQNWSPYTYGTEAKDLTYTSQDIDGLKKTLNK